MYYVLVMQILESIQGFMNDKLHNIFSKSLIVACLQDIGEAASIHIFDENPEAVLEIISIMVFYNVLMITYGHQSYFISD